MSVLEELYYGNIRPSEKCFDPASEYATFVKIIAENEEKLTAFLSSNPEAGEERHLFSQLMNAQSEVLTFSELSRFIEGFQLGARFMLDTFLFPLNSAVKDIA